MSGADHLRWAVSLFSFTNELLAATAPPDALLAALIAAEPGSTVEIDAAQHFRSFPVLDPGEVARTAGVVDAGGGAVSLLGGGAEVVPSPGRPIDEAVVLAQLASQVAAARMLGAAGVRLPFGVLPWPVLRRAAEDARTAGVLLLEEVQGPLDPAGPQVLGRLAELERAGETGVRLLLDTSAVMSGLPPTYLRALHAEGVDDDLVQRLVAAFAAGRVAPEVLPRLGDPTLSPAARSLLITAMTRFGSRAPSAWLAHAPWIASVHLKWWDLDSAEADLAGPVGTVLDGLLDAGFSGVVCSEWGGHEWQPLGVSAADGSAAHRRLVESRLAERPTDLRAKAT